MRETKDYEDILYMDRPPSRHPQMPNLERAAQFSPFAALTGYDDAVRESARLTEEQIDLGDWERQALDEKIQWLTLHVGEAVELSVTYFQPDEKKAGGKYVTKKGKMKKLKTFEREIWLEGEAPIPFSQILDLEGDIFQNAEL